MKKQRMRYTPEERVASCEVLAELIAEHAALKNRLGNSDRGLGAAR